MSRLTLFNSPLLLGFEHFERVLDGVSKASTDGYPPPCSFPSSLFPRSSNSPDACQTPNCEFRLRRPLVRATGGCLSLSARPPRAGRRGACAP